MAWWSACEKSDSSIAVPRKSATPRCPRSAESRGSWPSVLIGCAEGHTDNKPIHNAQFGDNWELSTARATELVRLLILKYGFAAQRLSAAGYAEYHPLNSNDTPEARAQNRRVDGVILGKVSANRIAPPADRDLEKKTESPPTGAAAVPATPKPSPAIPLTSRPALWRGITDFAARSAGSDRDRARLSVYPPGPQAETPFPARP